MSKVSAQTEITPVSEETTRVVSPPSSSMVAAYSEFFEGPMPHPRLLEDYERILPGLADRITKMAEEQATHRQRMEKFIMLFSASQGAIGQVSAFIVVIAGLIAGVYLVVNDKPVSGFLSLIAPLGTVAAIFFVDRRDASSEKDVKSQTPPKE